MRPRLCTAPNAATLCAVELCLAAVRFPLAALCLWLLRVFGNGVFVSRCVIMSSECLGCVFGTLHTTNTEQKQRRQVSTAGTTEDSDV